MAVGHGTAGGIQAAPAALGYSTGVGLSRPQATVRPGHRRK